MKSKSLFLLLFVTVIFISGCVQETTPSSSTNQEQTAQPKVQYKDSTNFLLTLSDLPQNENWTIVERGERNVNDVSSKALMYNWSGGYYTKFSLSGKDKVTYLEHYLSIYPDNKTMEILADDSDLGEPLSNPGIGDNSRAYKNRATVLGQEIVEYKIVFVKNNIFATITSGGTGTDYLTLKGFAQKAYDKIDGYGKPFDYQLLKTTSKIYKNDLYGFSILQPSGWRVNEKTTDIVKFDSQYAFISVNIVDVNISMFDNDFNRKIVIDALKEGNSNFVLLENKSMTLNGKRAYSLKFVTTIPTGENRAAQQVYVERNDNQVFLVAYVADSKQFETYRDVFGSTLNSFTIT